MGSILFSVIIIAFNNEQYIYSAIDSVIKQDYPEIELIVADDCSAVFDISKIEQYICTKKEANIISFYVYTNDTNLGTVSNINKAMSFVHGGYVKILGADDMLYDDTVLSKAADILDKSNDGIIVSHVMKCKKNMEPISLLKDRYIDSLSAMSSLKLYKLLAQRNIVPAPGVFFKSDFLFNNNLFDEKYLLLEDWPMWLRITRCGIKLDPAGFIGTKYRTNVGSTTSTNSRYIQDMITAYNTEIKPYRDILGIWISIKAYISLRLRTSVMLRNVFGMIFRQNDL